MSKLIVAYLFVSTVTTNEHSNSRWQRFFGHLERVFCLENNFGNNQKVSFFITETEKSLMQCPFSEKVSMFFTPSKGEKMCCTNDNFDDIFF